MTQPSSGFTTTAAGGAQSTGGFSLSTTGGGGGGQTAGLPVAKLDGGFSLAQKPGLPVGTGGASATLTSKCGISDMDEIRLAYAPLISVVDPNRPFPTLENVEPGGAKLPNKSCELYCWVYSPINPNIRRAHDTHDIQRREVNMKCFFKR